MAELQAMAEDVRRRENAAGEYFDQRRPTVFPAWRGAPVYTAPETRSEHPLKRLFEASFMGTLKGRLNRGPYLTAFRA